MGTNREQELKGVAWVLVLNPAMLIALAALISSLSAFIWALRRRP
jgi:hypothetical protein